MFKKILISVDGSEHANRAVEVGADLAAHYDAAVVVLHVMEEIGSNRVPEGLEYVEHVEHVHITEREVLMGVARDVVDAAAARCRSLGVKQVDEQVLVGNPREAIVRAAAERGVDLIVMGRRGLGRLADMLLGSVSHRVTQTADCACLTVK